MASISLKHRFRFGILWPFILVTTLLMLLVWRLDLNTQRTQSQAELALRMQTLNASFNAYLSRAESEARYLAEQIGRGADLDNVFQLHDVLFFGGLDFFYVELDDGHAMADPRARLYTQDALSKLVAKSSINTWRQLSSKDQNELLVYKKALDVDSNGQSLGYFYGFISLNNNLTLTSELLSSAGVDYLQINDVAGKQLVVEKHSSYADDSAFNSYLSVFTTATLEDKLTVELRVLRRAEQYLSGNVLIISCVILLSLLGLYWGVLASANRQLFGPIATFSASKREELLPYQEFAPLLSQMDHFQMQLKVRDQQFELLLDSLNSAVVFCDESARMTALNREASEIFPNHAIAKTIFDMTPIICHQPIQRALKGEYSGGFELEFPEFNRIYEWRSFSFVNEYGFRSAMLVGRDISELRRVRWQLTHLLPRHALERPQPPVLILLQELQYVQTVKADMRLEYASWLQLMGELLKEVSTIDELPAQYCNLGDVVAELQQYLDSKLHVKGQSGYKLEISLYDALKKAYWGTDQRLIIKVALLLCMKSSVSGRYVHFGWDQNHLLIRVYGILESTPVLDWVLLELPKLMKGKVESQGASRMSITLSLASESVDYKPLPRQRIALIENDCLEPERIITFFDPLAITVDSYASFDSFFSASLPYRVQYEAIFVGLGDTHLAEEGINRLNAMYSESLLPIVLIGAPSETLEVHGHHVVHSHQLTPYRLAEILTTLRDYNPIRLGDWATHGTNFIVIGGSELSQVIWLSELNSRGLVARRETDVEKLVSVLRHKQPVNILVLDKLTAQTVLQHHLVSLVNTRWVVLEDFPNRPDTMAYLEVDDQLPDNGVLVKLRQLLKIKG